MTASARGGPAAGTRHPEWKITEGDWERAVELVTSADEIALACHVAPDGDALGSMLAFGQAMRALGKRVVASFGDRVFRVPRLLGFLPGQELLVPPAAYPAAPALMVTFDASTVDRLGLLTRSATLAEALIVVDHHPSYTGFGTLGLVDPAAAATAVLVEEFIHRLGVPVSTEIAACLYTGLATDTGSFKYSSTSPSAHAMAGRLISTGLRPEQIARDLWDRSPYGYLKVLGAALDRVVLEPEAAGGQGLVWTYVTHADRIAQDLPYDEVEGIIDVVRRADEADVAVVLKQDDEGAWQVSIRSKGAVDVARIATELGGGGHVSAAGFTSYETVDTTMARFRDLLRTPH
ncbi:DHH family phosphoesterase [Sinosporangium siamense]|uniref:Phosphoesterase n=1 Tax=Sinosporangium siamense TaxID=1367973 RepID=A0A919RA57_9ACTN|nr:bifunctional oligoribonuclease/PAP phosphatase NrnA [Sinosporangium siamense]GII89842.1 phosphoesterase [Sinosporangium siamense]